MKLPHHAVKIWTATQQIKHPRIMVVWMFWSPWDIVYFCFYSFCPLSSTLLGYLTLEGMKPVIPRTLE